MDVQILMVENGDDLLAYLRHSGRFAEPIQSPRPDLILLDLNMPLKDGREALAEIKADDDLRSIPIIVLTTSQAQEDLDITYSLGASSFVSKPNSFKSLRDVICKIGDYWLETVQLPDEPIPPPGKGHSS
jgi:CheY-like chemotaxis protein